MFIFLGILLLLAAAAFIATSYLIPDILVRERRVRSEDGYGTNIEKIEVLNKNKPDFLKNKKIAYITFVIGIVFILVPYLFFFASPGYQYFLVYPNGKRDAVMTEGVKFRGFAKITEWDKYIDIKVVDSTSDMKAVSEIEGVMNPIPMRFIDQVTADAKVSARFQLPSSPEQFIQVAIEFRSLQNLVQTTLIPTIKEMMSNTGYMFAAQDYISGEAQNFRTTFEEQLSSGIYVVNKFTKYDTVFQEYDDPKIRRKIKSIKTSYTVEKVLVNGVPKRVPNEITKNGILVTQVIVDDIMLEPSFRKRLEAQRDESTKRQLEQQKVKTAKDAQARIIAEGERDKAAERVAQEKAQVATLIKIETNLKQEETNKQLAQVQLETQRLRTLTVKVKADGEAYEIRQKVASGITPQVKLQMELDAKVQMMGELAKTKWPTTYIAGASGGGDPINALISAAMAKQLGVKVK